MFELSGAQIVNACTWNKQRHLHVGLELPKAKVESQGQEASRMSYRCALKHWRNLEIADCVTSCPLL